jgi:hypothetical protein
MNIATRVTASIIGAYAGILGAVHGYFEILQGPVLTGGLIIQAVGPPCQADTVWHACLPAMTLMPNYSLTGYLTVIFSLAALFWGVFCLSRWQGGLVMILFSVLMLLVGAGFIPAFTGIIAGLAGLEIKSLLNLNHLKFLQKSSSILGRLWPWILIVFGLWGAGGWILGKFFNRTMLQLGFFLFFFCDLGLPFLALIAGICKDMENIK